MLSSIKMLLLTFFSLLSTILADSVCYSLDGQSLDATHQPCNPSAEFSACCALNGTDGNNDICLDSGLCQSTSGWYANFLYADGCTDKTGSAAACPNICAHIPKQFSYNILQCNPGIFCCRASYDTANCCNDTGAVVQTSHIGTLLFPDGAEINTTYNGTFIQVCPTKKPGVAGDVLAAILGFLLLATLVNIIRLVKVQKQLRHELASSATTVEQYQLTAKHDAPLLSSTTQVPLYQMNQTKNGYSTNSLSYGQSAPGEHPPVEMEGRRNPSELSNEPNRELTA